MDTQARILCLPGDGIGAEVMRETRRVIAWFEKARGLRIACENGLVGGACYDAHTCALTDETLEAASRADIVLLGAVGGPKWEGVPFEHRPEAGLLRLRKELGLFANLRPALCFPALADASTLKRDYVAGLDIIIVRELTGGVYFGEPRGIETLADGTKRAVNTQVYETEEIRRLARVAFELARTRDRRVVSVEKRNVMETGILWHDEVAALHKADYADIHLSHMLADNCAMQLIRDPKQFDVIATDNLFGDMLSDAAAMLTGSLGMLPSASIGAAEGAHGPRGLYEPVHGSAPDIAGQDRANPLAMILSFAMALRTSLGRADDALHLEAAVADVLAQGVRTADIAQKGETPVSTTEMGDAVCAALERV